VGLSVIALIITIALRQRQSLIAARERYEQAQVFLSDRDYLLAERAAADSLLHEDRPETRALLLEARARGARFSGRDALLGAVRCISRDARLVAYIGVSDEHDPMGNEAAKRLYVWDRKSGRRDALPPSTSVVHRAAFDPDGHILWYGTDTGVLKAWDRTRRREASISVPTPLSSGVSIDSLACQPADKEVAFGTSAVRKGVD
jgi:hypothetical protein